MRCTAQSTARSRTRLSTWLLAAALASNAAAQQPEHYGPPACSPGAQPPAKSDLLQRAEGERKEAIENSRIVLSQAAGGLDAVAAGHAQVHQYDMWP